MHVFPFHALNKNLDKVIKARLITESFQIMHIFLPRPCKNGLSEQVKICKSKCSSFVFVAFISGFREQPLQIFVRHFLSKWWKQEWVCKRLRFVLTLLLWILFPYDNIFKLVWLNRVVIITCSYVDSCFSLCIKIDRILSGSINNLFIFIV